MKPVRILLIALLFFSPVTWGADELTMSECIYRAEITLKVMQAVDAGTPFDKIELHANDPAASPAEQAEHDQFFAEFKANIAAAIAATDPKGEQHAERVAQTLLESCAYQVGIHTREKTEHDRATQNAQTKLGDNALAVYKLAASMLKVPVGELPNVSSVSHAKLVELAHCKSNKCPVKGFQLGNDVFIDETLDMKNIQNVGIVLHEFVHHLQWIKAGQAKDCREWVDREIVAYHLQNEMLSKAGAQLVQSPSFPNCEGK